MRRTDPQDLEACRIYPLLEGAVRVIDEGHAAGHAGPEIVSDLAKDHDTPAGHIFTGVGAGPLDHRSRARVTDTQPFASLASGKHLARRGTIKDGVANDRVLMRDKGRGR